MNRPRKNKRALPDEFDPAHSSIKIGNPMAEDPVNFIHGSGSLGQAYEGHGFMRFRIQSIQPSFFTYQHGSVFLNDVFLETFFIITTRKCYFIHSSTVSHNKNRFFFCGAVSKFEFSLEVDIKIIFSLKQ